MSTLTYQDVVLQIKDRLDIVDVISKYVILKKQGGNYWGCCPFHNEKTPSFSVSPAKQIYKCFGCGEGGDVLSFLMKINNQSFHEVVKEQAEILGIELPASFDKGKDNKDIKEQIYSCMKDAAEFYKKTLLENQKVPVPQLADTALKPYDRNSDIYKRKATGQKIYGAVREVSGAVDIGLGIYYTLALPAAAWTLFFRFGRIMTAPSVAAAATQ